ncbi:MAG: hypothetical protein WCK84_01765 [Bacteroidota bacterium]
MNTSEIEVLLEKYYEGNTTLHEEKLLREYFLKADLPETLKSHQKMFGFFAEESHKEIPDPEFDQKITNLISEAHFTVPVKSMNQHRNRFVFITSIAASILILIGLFFTLRHDFLRKETPIQFTANQELAFTEANEALMIFSSNFNAGLKQMEHLNMVNKAMNNLQLFNRFYQYQTIIINPDEIQQQSINSKQP